MSLHRQLLAVITLMGMLCQAAYADTLNIPNSFVAGTTIQSSQMNANFGAISTWSTNITNTNIKAGAAIDPVKLDFTKQIGPILRTAANNCFSAGVTGDTVPRFAATSDGWLQFGAGGASAQDVRFHRVNSDGFAIDSGTGSDFRDIAARRMVLQYDGSANEPSLIITKTGGNTIFQSLGSTGVTTVESLSLESPLTAANGGTGLTAIGTAYQVLRTNSAANALEFGAVDVSVLPSTALVIGGVGGATSRRTLPTSGTLTGEYWHVGNWTSTNSITCNRCRIHVAGTVNIAHAITVNTELSGGKAGSGGNLSPGAIGLGLGAGSTNTLATGATANNGGGGGGGNGGAGGNGGGSTIVAAGGGAYEYEHQLAGSSGASGTTRTTAGGAGGAGGGAFYLEASGNVTFSGSGAITANGGNGTAGTGGSDGGGGGGSGGTIAIITGGVFTGAGANLTANGGNGGAGGGATIGGGGGGGGGRIFIRYGSIASAITASVTGGSAGSNGSIAATAGASGVDDEAAVLYSTRSAP